MSVQFDDAREARIGIPEAVFCASKPEADLRALFTRFAAPETAPILFTRVAPDRWACCPEELRPSYDYDPVSRTAWNKTRGKRPTGRVALVSAGTADGAVIGEAARTIEYLGWTAVRFEDCGVAGLWRIQKAIADINACDVVICAAGLDAALASVLGGLTDRPIFAVPTSVGYGVAAGGETALRSMLASCAPGVAVMNIDNGYGAACAAARVLRALGH
ncbi:MAG: nickel pincer cofactor biosynthesis protein LarB [Sutterella parvirubra]|uniref:PurE domain-containing protein n=1 Tax=Sutterella parvirubra YIT 11816 TaxID=762967 RepID=H3KGM8_9BURK|nr:nickel pincer cofactor biosynthesis protein LarB [Sutterella parvirubra]EHY30726.1 hypothetical protein HMPREF9440_01910 [Sutterella parvirubra YIT 11816]MCI7709969.1 nickel pincer cofactor biosynthesis protein LarB [Sutterella parvirubra]MDY5202228.1 nickel pincer cofactor biosynthesis protein LarB [Sutterella parvirubra]